MRLALLTQRGHLFGWAPVCLACGIGLFFMQRVELSVPTLVLLAVGAVIVGVVTRWIDAAVSPFGVGVALILIGVVLAAARAHLVAGPVIGWRYYGPVEGRIVGIDRSASDALRITLDRVVLRDVAPAQTPRRVRLSLHSEQAGTDPLPGLTVMTMAHLSPPSGPVEPGGFDFQRHAWFQMLGAVGYTRVPLMALEPADGANRMFAFRMALSAHVQDTLPGEPGAFAAAIMTGDRSGMGQGTLTDLRVSNLAHLLAISGLHMGLLAGFVFATLRYGLALMPWVALRVQSKPLAAAFALAAAAMYLALSGGSIATERAFIMAAVMLVAVMLNRRALSLRAVALAALITLGLRPEALMGPGFQMSFAATTALIAVFGWLRDSAVTRGPRWARPVIAVVVSSGVAGFATAPIAAAHFNQFAHYGLIANLLSVPLMGVLVMPAAVLSACLLPFGLEGAGLWVMGLGLKWILAVAHWTAGLDGARGMVISPGPWVLPVLALGALFVILWQGRLRLIGLVAVVGALVMWMQAQRPDVLIADTGALVGVLTAEGRALSAAAGGGFVAENWLENDGDKAGQEQAARRWGAQMAEPLGFQILAIKGKRAAAGLTDCKGADWVVLNTTPPEGLPCTVIDPERLRRTGAMALFTQGKAIKVVTARDVTGKRLWNSAEVRMAFR
ncbi:ComEC/Rec2 family competence protein [Roseovarius aestuarii]|nr:ComEC/Rec2 family competence protein [Roseovarius aestuarii]